MMTVRMTVITMTAGMQKICKTPDSRLWQLMNEAKEFNASIGNKYDGIERMHQDYAREEDDGFAVNPSGSSIQNNIIISKQNKVGEIAKTVQKIFCR